MLSVICWKWKPAPGYRSKFEAAHVHVLRNMVARHYSRPHRFICVTDDPAGIDDGIEVIPLWSEFSDVRNPWGAGNPSCYRRLRMFSDEALSLFGERFVSVDLDCVITSDITSLWDRTDDFVIWGDTAKKTPYNGSMIMLRAGARTKVYNEFDPRSSPSTSRAMGFIGSDQAWIAASLGPNETKWTRADGVYSFRNEIAPKGGALPPDAKIVFFHGHQDPWGPQAQRLSWVRDHWR